jgi:hypothetical protein
MDPGSEWRLHCQWFEENAMSDLLGEDFALVEKNALYRCLDKLLEHKTALFDYLRQRWQDLFGADTAYLLAHYFVFERSGRAVHDEYVRFGWWISPQFFKSRSLVFGSPILAFPRLGFSWHSDMIVHITSIAVPVFTSYLGHKNFSLCKKQADSQI